MHHFETETMNINYNPDFSIVKISLKDTSSGYIGLEIDGMELLNFVAQCYVAPEKIRRLEQAETESILFG